MATGYICRGIPEGFGDPAQEAGHLLCRNRYTQSPGHSAGAGAGWPGRPRQGRHLREQPAAGTGCRPHTPLPGWARPARKDAPGVTAQPPPGWQGRACAADIYRRAKAGSQDRGIIRAPWGRGPRGFGAASDAEANFVKVTYIVQGIGGRVNAMGQQAGDTLKTEAEGGLGTSSVSTFSLCKQSSPRTDSVAQNSLKASCTRRPRAGPPFWRFLPGLDQETVKTCSIGRIRETQRKVRERGTPGRKEVPDLQGTNYPQLPGRRVYRRERWIVSG